MDLFNDLLPDCQLEVMKRLGTEDLISLTAVNKKWNSIAYKLIKYAEVRHLTSPQVISKLIGLEELILNFFDLDAPWWFGSLTSEMLLLTNLRRLRTEYWGAGTDYSEVEHPEDKPHFDLLRQMTYLEDIEVFSAKVPYLDKVYSGFSRLTALHLNTPFDEGIPKFNFFLVEDPVSHSTILSLGDLLTSLYVDCANYWQMSSRLRKLSIRQSQSIEVRLPLQNATNLTFLQLDLRGVKNRIGHLTNLKELDIRYEYASPPFESADLTRLKQLYSIRLHAYDDLAIDFLTVLPKLAMQLNSLHLNIYIDWADPHRELAFAYLKEITGLVNLTSLQFNPSVQDAAGIEISRLTNLKRLNPGLSREVTSLTHLPNLEYLYFDNHLHLPEEEAFGLLTKLTALTELEIRWETAFEENPLLPFVVEKFTHLKKLTGYRVGRGGTVRTDLRSEWKRQKELADRK